MTAIAGVWDRRGREAAEVACQSLLAAYAKFGSNPATRTTKRGFACGRILHRSVPEDCFDRQPVRSADGRYLLVADIRIDNRDELARALGRTAGEYAQLSDSQLLLDFMVINGASAVHEVIGDFAFALWDDHEKQLLLGRDALGERPLHFAMHENGFLFGSLPGQLAKSCNLGVDEHRLACLIGDLPAAFRGSYFKGVHRVSPAHLVTIAGSNVSQHRYWHPLNVRVSQYRDTELGDALQEQLDAAVRRRLRRSCGMVGAHLSSGLDSSSVGTSAALALMTAGDQLHAFTSAPMYPTPVPKGWLADESELAQATCELHPNVVHHVVRSAADPFDLTDDHLLAGQPVGGVLNNGWIKQINELARGLGVTVMLTGEAGNATISAGLGWDDLADILRCGRFMRWCSEAGGLWRDGIASTTLLKGTFAPFLPRSVRSPLARAVRRNSLNRATFQSRAARVKLEGLTGDSWESISDLAGRERRASILGLIDPAAFRKRTLALWGVEERDPTADRRLVEFCFSLPVRARLNDGVRRPALMRAIHGRVPPRVLDSKARGLQSADWKARLSQKALQDFADTVRHAPHAHLIDWTAVDAEIAQWRDLRPDDHECVYRVSNLLRVLASAHFSMVHDRN